MKSENISSQTTKQNKSIFKSKILYVSLVSAVVLSGIIFYHNGINDKHTKEVANIIKNESLSQNLNSYPGPPTTDLHDCEEVKCSAQATTNLENTKTASYLEKERADDNKFEDLCKPIDGRVLNEYSDDELTYCKTMEDFRIHDAIDIQADIGTNIKSVCSGTVTEIVNDEMYGTSVLIKHNDKYSTKYCGLQEVVLVKEGQHVAKGQALGGVGNSGICEISEPSHLHFQIIENSRAVNPADFIIFKSK